MCSLISIFVISYSDITCIIPLLVISKIESQAGLKAAQPGLSLTRQETILSTLPFCGKIF